MVFGILGVEWSDRQKVLDKVTKHASNLIIDFRDKKKHAQSLAFRLEKWKSLQTAPEGVKDAAPFDSVKHEQDAKRIAELILVLENFTSTINTVITFFMRLKPIADKMEKYFNSARRLKKKGRTLKKHLGIKRKLLRKKCKYGRHARRAGEKRAHAMLKEEIKDLSLEIKIVKGELVYTVEEFNTATNAYKSYKKRFRKEHRVILKLIGELRSEMKTYVVSLKWLAKDPRFVSFIGAIHTKHTRKTMRKLGKWLTRYRLYYFILGGK